jgi:prolyl 4-hydroxylase
MAKDFEEPLLQEPSSTEEDDEDWEDDGEEEYDDEDSAQSASFWSDLKEAWRQHAVAMLMAFAATALYYYSKHHDSRVATSHESAPALLLDRHSHLEGYRRTSNLTFCSFAYTGDNRAVNDASMMSLAMAQDLRPRTLRLTPMDFNIPKSLVRTLRLHYLADQLEDDDYSRVLSDEVSTAGAFHMTPESRSTLGCIDRLVEETTQSYIKGFSYYYKTPSFESMYEGNSNRGGVLSAASRPHPAHLTFTGFAAKFFNLSPKPVLLFWDGRSEEQRKLVGEIAPFESLGTATTPGQSFSVSPVYDSSHALDRWVVTADDCLLYYEPEDMISGLSSEQRKLYNMHKLNQEFAKHYLIHSGRAWLSNFPRAFPVHSMIPANFFGEVHTIQDEASSRTFELKVESVTPRVFSIDNFLSHEECAQLVKLALQQGLHASTVYSGSLDKQQRDLHTRSSMNTWLARSTAELTDRIYRRAAAVLGLDESLLQPPVDDERLHAHVSSLAESLQIVRYKRGQEYTAHHDFVYPSQKHRLQPTRFATLLLYLNDDYMGGQTVFPRAVNAHYHDGISIDPKKGKGVLFYNVLPDGNVDDLSQHSSKPVKRGEKVRSRLCC